MSRLATACMICAVGWEGSMWAVFLCGSLFLCPVHARNLQDLDEEDILMAELEMARVNKSSPSERAGYKGRELGTDRRVDKRVEEAYVCGDVCPDNGSVYLRYKGVDKEECAKIGRSVHTPGWGGYAGCRPKPVPIDIHLKSGAKKAGAVVVDKTDLVLKIDDGKGVVLLKDIAVVESGSGRKLAGFQAALHSPAASTDPVVEARRYFDAGVSKDCSREEAIVLLREAIALDPGSAQAYYKLSERYGRRVPEEIPLYEGLVRLRPQEAKAYLVLAQSTVEADRDDPGSFDKEKAVKAVRLLEKAVQVKPDFADAHWLLAKYSANLLNDYPRAVRHYERWIELTKPHPIAF
ncbi:MAG: hypothetical protein NTX64_08625 [Elusimicrobia bacterium]|nr:hypothetical protein [Elusimicrobiota bacterium]